MTGPAAGVGPGREVQFFCGFTATIRRFWQDEIPVSYV